MQYVKQLAELVVMTYFATLAGLTSAAGFDFMNLGAWKAAAVAAFPATLVALYGVLAKPVGNNASPLATAPQTVVQRVVAAPTPVRIED